MKRFAFNGLFRLLATFLQVCIFVVVARNSDVGIFGVFSAAITFGQVALAVFEFGMTNRVLVYEVQSWGKGLTAYGKTRALFWVLFVLLSATLQTAGLSQLAFASSALAISTSEALGDLACSIWQGKLQTYRAGGLLLARKLLSFLVILSCSFSGNLLLGILAASTIGVLIFYLEAWPFRDGTGGLRDWLSAGGRLAAVSVAANLAQLDVVIVLLVLGPVSAGLYSPATRLVGPVNVLASSAFQILMPKMSKHSRDRDSRLKIYDRSLKYSYLVVILMIAAIPMLHSIVQFVFGLGYTSPLLVTVAVFASAGLMIISQADLSWLLASGTPKHLPIAMFSSVFAGYVAIAAFGQIYGTEGAATGVLFMHILASTCIKVFAVRSRRKP